MRSRAFTQVDHKLPGWRAGRGTRAAGGSVQQHRTSCCLASLIRPSPMTARPHGGKAPSPMQRDQSELGPRVSASAQSASIAHAIQRRSTDGEKLATPFVALRLHPVEERRSATAGKRAGRKVPVGRSHPNAPRGAKLQSTRARLEIVFTASLSAPNRGARYVPL